MVRFNSVPSNEQIDVKSLIERILQLKWARSVWTDLHTSKIHKTIDKNTRFCYVGKYWDFDTANNIGFYSDDGSYIFNHSLLPVAFNPGWWR